MLLFVLLALVAGVGIALAGKAAARHGKNTDPVALKAEVWQYLAAGPLTAASAALIFTLLRVSPAIHVAAMCPVTKALHPGMRPFLCSSAPAIWMFYLVAGPLIGLAIAACAGAAATAPQPPGLPPPKPPREPPSDGSHWGGVFVKM
jgi:MFS family permease